VAPAIGPLDPIHWYCNPGPGGAAEAVSVGGELAHTVDTSGDTLAVTGFIVTSTGGDVLWHKPVEIITK